MEKLAWMRAYVSRRICGCGVLMGSMFTIAMNAHVHMHAFVHRGCCLHTYTQHEESGGVTRVAHC